MSDRSEVLLLEERAGQPYSQGHMAMYETVAALLQGQPGRILEIGFGVGYGLRKLIEADCINSYVGIERDPLCVGHVTRTLMVEQLPGVYLLEADFLTITDAQIRSHFGEANADVSLCIEVLEHVPRSKGLDFLVKLRNITSQALLLSTPNSNTSTHGIYRPAQVLKLLEMAGFPHVACLSWQWTTFFLATLEPMNGSRRR